MSLSSQSLPDLDRYEQFQTFSGLSNHALADLVNAIIYVPFYTIYTFWGASWFREMTLAIYDKFLWSSLYRYSP